MSNEIISNQTSSEETAAVARKLAEEIRLDDPALSTTYGTDAMRNISKFADTLLKQVSSKDTGPVGESLNVLLGQVKEFDPRSIADERPSPFTRLPFIGHLFDNRQRTVLNFNTLSGQVDAIAFKLEEAMTSLLRDIEVLEQLYALNRDFHNDLALYLEAGQIRLQQAKETELPALIKEAENSPDSMAAQNVRDFSDQINRFERRMHDLQISRTIALQTAPQIRLIQSNDQTLAEKIQTSILTTIPIWKSQMVLALSIYAQKGAVALQKQVADTTNAMLKNNAAMLQQATIDTARQVERSIVDMETLREVHGKLISTIEETLRIAQEGRSQRRQAEQELSAMEQDLKVKLTALAQSQAQNAINDAGGSEEIAAGGPGTEAPGKKDPAQEAMGQNSLQQKTEYTDPAHEAIVSLRNSATRVSELRAEIIRSSDAFTGNEPVAVEATTTEDNQE